jgi:hypothetical protein
MEKGESPAGQLGINNLPNSLFGGEQFKPFVYRQCFGVFLDTNDCETCEARRQCKEALFVCES